MQHIISLSLLLLLSATMALAEELPAAEAAFDPELIYIESDTLDVDDARGVSVYRGSVHFRRGSTQMWADVVTVYSKNRAELERFVADGKPARFHQAPQLAEDEAVQGEALRIEYYANRSVLTLEGEAHLERGKSSFSGEHIEYEAEAKIVRATKAKEGGGRVQVVIQPGQQAAPGDSAAPVAIELRQLP